MATFKDLLKGTPTEQKKTNTFSNLLVTEPTVDTRVFETRSTEPLLPTRETIPRIEQPRQTTPPVTSTGSLSSMLQPYVEQGRKINRQKALEEERRKQLLAGSEERLANLLEQSRAIETSPEPDVRQQTALTEDILSTRNLITANQPGFQSGFRESFGLQPTARFDAQQATQERQEASQQAIEQARQQEGFGTGRVIGELGKQAALYATVGAALKGTQLGASLASKLGGGRVGEFAANQVVDLLVDTVIQTPQELARGDQWKDIGMNRLLDIGINLGIGGSAEYIKSLRNVDTNAFEQAVKQLSPEDAQIVRQALDTKVDVPLSTSTRAFEPPQINKAVDDFQKWRSQNFGGATGQLPEGDLKAVRDLYFEDTGKYIADQDLRPFVKTDLGTLTAPRLSTGVDNFVDRPPIFDQPIQQRTFAEALQSPRTPDIETPSVDVSPAGFIDTARQSDVTTKELTKRIKDLELQTTSNEARTALAKQIVDEDFDTALRMVKEGDQFGSAVESEIGRDLVTRLQQQGRNAEAIEVIESLSKKFRRAGQDVQAASIWSRSTPEGMQKWAVNKLNEANVKVDENLIKEVGDDMRTIDQMTPQELGRRVAQKIGQDNDFVTNQILSANSYDQLKSLNTAITMGKVFDKIPIVKARKLSSIQAMSHLLNGRTFLRNIFGNTASIAGEITSRVPASIVDRGLKIFTGNRSISSSMPNPLKLMKEGYKQGKRSFFEIVAGANRAPQGKYDLLFGSSFKSKLGQGLEKTLGVSLQTPDEFFKGFTKADSLFNQVKARLGKQVDKWSFDEVLAKATPEEIEQAIKEAQFATFQNDSGLADFMSKTKSLLNRVHLDSSKRFLKETGEFGLGDLTLKYTRVPGNIITRGFEYSPIGYNKIAPFILNPDALKTLTPQAQRELALQIGRATTGSGLMYLGAKLADAGIITGAEDSRDFDVQAFDRAEGLGDYKINLDALKRLAAGESTDPQPGDTIKSYNWLNPMTTPIAVGARLQAENPENFADLAAKAGTATWEEALDLPTLYIVKKMFYEGMGEDSTPFDVLSLPIEEAIPGFVPSAVRQVAQTIDPTFRDTRGEDEALNKIKANIPFLSQTLPPRIDVLGREQQRQPGLFPNLIDPATTTTAQPTTYGEDLRLIREITGKTSIFPDRKPPTSITVNRQKIDLTPEEQREWQRIEGELVDQRYTELLNRIQITEQNAANVAKQLENIKREAGEVAKRTILSNRR